MAGACRILRASVFFFIALLSVVRASEPTPIGLWKTIDDKSHKARGTVSIYERNGAFFGRIESSFDPKEAAERCDACAGDRKDRPVIGLEILRDMKKKGSLYDGGEILDPETGLVYRCRMWLEDGGNHLVVRGFIGLSLFGRSQTWVRER